MISKHGSILGTETQAQRSPNALSGRPRAQDLRKSPGAWGVPLVLVLLALEAGGCNGWFRPVDWSDTRPEREQQSPFRVLPRHNTQVTSLSPDDIVRIMQRVGFRDEQIVELGTDLHNAMRFHGSAVIVYKKETLAIFAADGDYVRVRTRSGDLDYQVSKGQFVSAPPRDR